MRQKRTFQDTLPKKLASECLTVIRRRTLSSTPHDKTLLQQVVGKNGDEKGFLYGGFTVSVGIRAALRTIGKRINDFDNILDFGCGTGRVLRWFQDVTPRSQLHGCDINSEAIRWCVANIPFAKFVNSDPVPPLPFPDHAFDLIYGTSVLTHLDENFQQIWLEELRRLIKPGGIVLLTAQGEDRAIKVLSEEEYDSFKRTGFLYKRAVDPSLEGLPDFYQITFHSRAYVESTWGRFFDILAYLKHGCLYAQNLALMSGRQVETDRNKRETDERESAPITADLPMAVIDLPMAGDSEPQNEMLVKGWAFHPDGKEVSLKIMIDGKFVGQCDAKESRPDVADAFYTPSASNSGFSQTVSIRGLRKGWHVVWLSGTDSPLPLCATYFLVPESLIVRGFRDFRNELNTRFGEAVYTVRCKIRLRTRLRKLLGRLSK